MNVLLRLIKYLRPYWKFAVLNLFCALSAVILGMFSPWLQKLVIDQGIIGEEYHLIFKLTLLIVAFAVGKGLLKPGHSIVEEALAHGKSNN